MVQAVPLLYDTLVTVLIKLQNTQASNYTSSVHICLQRCRQSHQYKYISSLTQAPEETFKYRYTPLFYSVLYTT